MVKKRNVLPRGGDPLDTNRLHWKCTFSIYERLWKISVMLHEGIESASTMSFR